MTIACVAFAATAATAQHLWKPPVKTSGTMDAIRPITLRPQAISVGANGIYCPDMSEGAVGVHDLGWLPAGLNVVVTVESSTTAAFDPVAAVIVAAVGEGAGNTVKTTTFYDNDSAGEKNARVTFVAPAQGTYLLLVTDYQGKSPGCYRYQVDIR
jgi:hypothetical protein